MVISTTRTDLIKILLRFDAWRSYTRVLLGDRAPATLKPVLLTHYDTLTHIFVVLQGYNGYKK